jgi:hypothetical protein
VANAATLGIVSLRRIVGVFLLGAGALGLVICKMAWGDWSYLGELIAWIALTWGLTFVSWGLTLTWLETRFACLLGAASGIGSAVIALLRGMRHPQWSGLTFPCVIAGGVGCLAGLAAFAVAQRRATRKPAP